MILATYREPFGFCPHVQRFADGVTLLDMRNRMGGLPESFNDRGVICINGVPAPPALWGMIRPKPVAVTEVTFHYPPAGGGGDGKNILGLIASIAITVVSGGIASGALLGGLTGAAAAGGATVLSLALAAGVSLAGSLLVSALIPPPSVDQNSSRNLRNPGAASADGNVLAPNTPIPRVVGQRKVFPPMGMEPFTYYDGPDEVVEACYVLAGPHQISNIRVGSAEIEGVPDIEYEVSPGWTGSPPVSLLSRQSRTEALQSELRGHIVSEDNGARVESETGDLATSLPQIMILATRDEPDEHQIQITFGQGLHRNASDTDLIRVPLRLRIRPIGTGSWINLPELHYQAANIRQLRATIKLVWTDVTAGAPSASNSEGWVEARAQSAAQTADPASDVFDADPYFYGAGDVWMNANNLGSTGVENVSLDRYTATITLDTATFPKGRYEVELIRGNAFLNADYVASAYTYSGSVWNFFGYKGVANPTISMSRDGVADTLYVMRSVSVWNEHPMPARDVAVIALRARNRAVDRLSCVAGGWVRDWSGAAWDTWTITDNPAPHLRDILVGTDNLDPVPLELIDDANLVAWRQRCIDTDYSCNALIEDQTVDDAARIVAACGYAKPYMSDVWGVVMDYDRSAESPVQIFTSRNIANFQWTKGFARVPDGFRVNFRDASRDYDMHQISVFREGASNDSGRIEQITLEGLVTESDVVQRAIYDQRQAQLRSTFYSFDCGAENITVRRGDLVGVAHDMISQWTGAARITAVGLDSGGDVVWVETDQPLDVPSYYFMDDSPDLSEEPNLALLGVSGGIAIRRGASVSVHPVVGGSGNVLEFAPPIDGTGVDVGGLVAVGALGFEMLRLIVFGVTPRPNFEATMTLVDEAPGLWS
jgi:hypothetical protein